MSLFTQYFESYDIYVNCYKQIIREKVVFVRLQAREVKERVSGSIRGQGGPGPPPRSVQGSIWPPQGPPGFFKILPYVNFEVGKFYPLQKILPTPFFCHPTPL